MRFHVNKGFTIKQWHKAVDLLRENQLRVKTYLIFKPPFMSEGDALKHTTKWLVEVSKYSDEVSVNPMNIQKNTLVDRLFRNREYRPPWIWSLVEMIKRAHLEVSNLNCRVLVHPTAGGKIRGAHNCKQCDSEAIAAIERYSVSGEIDEFSTLDCSCKLVWQAELSNDSTFPVPIGTGTSRRGFATDMVRAP